MGRRLCRRKRVAGLRDGHVDDNVSLIDADAGSASKIGGGVVAASIDPRRRGGRSATAAAAATETSAAGGSRADLRNSLEDLGVVEDFRWDVNRIEARGRSFDGAFKPRRSPRLTRGIRSPRRTARIQLVQRISLWRQK